MENGAIRNFESVRLAAIQAEAEAKQKKEEEVNNPMKVSAEWSVSWWSEWTFDHILRFHRS